MTFWIAIALLTVFAVMFVLVPLALVRENSGGTVELDKAFYLARKEEIENDLAMGRIDDDTARAAIAEESRKLIAAAETRSLPAPTSLALSRLTALAGIVSVPVVAVALYLNSGNPQMPDQRISARQNLNLENQRIEELVARAEAHLAGNPDDARGWQVLAPIYTRLGRDKDAAQAWANLLRLKPELPEVRANLAESLVAAAGGVVTEEASRLFLDELNSNISSAKARFYLAMAKSQEGKHAEAVSRWDDLIAGGSDQSPWMEAAKTFRAESARLAGIAPLQEQPNGAPSADAADGPSKEQVEAAAALSPGERREMIASMVASLADRLQDEPSDLEGWKRLVRAYIVLGDKEAAKMSAEKAIAVNSGQSGFVEEMMAVIAGLGKKTAEPSASEQETGSASQ